MLLFSLTALFVVAPIVFGVLVLGPCLVWFLVSLLVKQLSCCGRELVVSNCRGSVFCVFSYGAVGWISSWLYSISFRQHGIYPNFKA